MLDCPLKCTDALQLLFYLVRRSQNVRTTEVIMMVIVCDSGGMYGVAYESRCCWNNLKVKQYTMASFCYREFSHKQLVFHSGRMQRLYTASAVRLNFTGMPRATTTAPPPATFLSFSKSISSATRQLLLHHCHLLLLPPAVLHKNVRFGTVTACTQQLPQHEKNPES